MKSLETQIADYEVIKRQKLPAEILDTMAAATEDLISRGIADHSLRSGDKVPEFYLSNHQGEVQSLYSLLEASPVVLSFYRGGWCPYCNMELKSLQSVLPEIEAHGARLVAVSPEKPDKSLSTREKNELAFDVLFDIHNKVAEKFGLVFDLPEELRPIYANLGIDLPDYNGDESFKLPMPATYIIAQDGSIEFDFVDPDYTRRLEPQAVVKHLSTRG